MNVKDVLALANITPDAVEELDDMLGNTFGLALAGDLVIGSLPQDDPRFAEFGVHHHDGNVAEARECYEWKLSALRDLIGDQGARVLDHTAVTASHFV